MLGQLMSAAYDALPEPALSPSGAYDALVRGQCAAASLAQLAGGVAGTAIVPYPPGIPLVMPGERLGPANGAILRYLAALEAFDLKFPGFGHDTHGIEVIDGVYTGTRLTGI
jgi:arginine/lysine/ornithine decarboxylase